MLVHAPTRPGQPIDEDSPLDPKWDYPKSKVKTEELIRAERGAIPVVILRIAGVYDDRCHSIPLAHQIQRIYERSSPATSTRPTRRTARRSSTSTTWWTRSCALVERRAQLPPETVLLIGEPETLGYEELQETLGRLIHGEEWPTYRVPKPVAKAGAWVQEILPFEVDPFIKPWMIDRADDHYELDIDRARKLLGWEPKHSLRETLPKMVEALKRDPVGWYRAHKLELPEELAKSAAAGARS